MAIQNRRGIHTDFDATKMVAGEFAVVQSGDPNNTNGTSVYICFQNGSAKRLALVEDLDAVVGSLSNLETTDKTSIVDAINELAEKSSILFGTSSTGGSTRDKVVTCADFEAVDGALIAITVSQTNTVTDARFNVNGTGAKSIYSNHEASTDTSWLTKGTYLFVYNSINGGRFTLIGATERIASDTAPAMNGTAAVGTSKEYARADHVHPSDTSRATVAALTAETTARTNADNAINGEITQLKEDLNELNSNLTAVDNIVNGTKTLVNITEIRSRIITASGQLLNAQVGYSCFVFPLEMGKKHIIRATGNEVLRVAFDDGNSDQTRTLNNVHTSTDLSVYEFVNNDNWGYCYLFGTLPTSPNATFSVCYVDEENSLINSIDGLNKKAVEIGDEAEYVGSGTARGSLGKIVVNDCVCSILTKAQYSYINLENIPINTNLGNSDNYISASSYTFTDGDVIDVNVDVTINGPTFQKFGLGVKTPNSLTTKLTFFNISSSALDADGKFTFSKVFKLADGDTFGIPFIYIGSSDTRYDNPLTINGTISVKKYQQVVDHVSVNGTTFYLKQWEDNEETILARGNVRTVGALHKNGIHIVDANDVPVELRGVGLHHILQYNNLHSWESFRDLKRMGVNMIRCTVYLHDRTYASSDNEPTYGYISHPDETKAEIERIVKNCIDLGLYVILDWHNLDDYITAYKTEALDFFDYYSKKYANIPNIIYEFANEPYADDSATIASYVQDVRAVVLANTTNPIMLVGQPAPLTDAGGNINWNIYDRCSALYSALSALGITDVFVSPHNYGSSAVSEFTQCLNNNIPIFISEWGNSDSDGDGSYHDTSALAQINYCHENAIAQSLWKYTDQTMKSSLLVNYGIINSERYASGFTSNDLSHNGVLLLGRYYDFIRDEWIVRTAIQ